MKTNIISVKYESDYEPKIFEGKPYIYYTDINVNLGDLVIAPTAYGELIAIVSEVNIHEYRVEQIKQYLKTIKHKIDKNAYLQENKVVKRVA